MALLDDLRQSEFTDRLASRILGVDLEAPEAEVRAAFRTRVRAVHPDTAVGVGCVDIGRLAEAKDKLVARARRTAAEAARDAAEVAATTTITTPAVEGRSVRSPFRPFDYRSGFEVVDRRGVRIDLAG